MADIVGDFTLRNKADCRRKLYVVFAVSAVIAVGISLVVSAFVFVAFIVLYPLAIAVLCLLIGLMRRAESVSRGFVMT